MHVEAVGEGQRGAFLDVVVHFVLVHVGDLLVRQQDHDHVGALDGLGHFLDLQAGVGGLVPRRAALAQADRHVDARILQVQRVGVALRAITDDGDVLALDQREVGVLVVKHFHDKSFNLCLLYEGGGILVCIVCARIAPPGDTA
ncbi:hypothetical protein D9M69_622470 [compost metagenome]